MASTGSGGNLREGFESSSWERSFEDLEFVSMGSTLNRLGGVDDDILREGPAISQFIERLSVYSHDKNDSSTQCLSTFPFPDGQLQGTFDYSAASASQACGLVEQIAGKRAIG